MVKAHTVHSVHAPKFEIDPWSNILKISVCYRLNGWGYHCGFPAFEDSWFNTESPWQPVLSFGQYNDLCIVSWKDRECTPDLAGSDLGGVRWVRTNPPFCWVIRLTGALLLPAVFDTQRCVPVQFGYCIISSVQFDSKCMQYNFFYLVQLTKASLIKMGVVTQNFSARSARALFQKNPPSLIPGSAPA